MYVKLSPRNLNFGLCPSHLTSTYICGMTIVLRVCSLCPSHLTSTYICGMTIVLRVCGGREIFIKLEGAQPLN